MEYSSGIMEIWDMIRCMLAWVGVILGLNLKCEGSGVYGIPESWWLECLYFVSRLASLDVYIRDAVFLSSEIHRID